MNLRAFGSDLPPDGDDTGKSVQELLLQDEYQPSELALLLDLPLTLIEHEAYSGHLKSFIVGHNVICIRREDAIAWLERRG
jgi:hypothetical protein